MRPSYCTNCGYKITREDIYCRECGIKVATLKKPSNSMGKIFVAALAILLVVVVLVIAVSDGDSETASKPLATPKYHFVEQSMQQFSEQHLNTSGVVSAAVVNVLCPYSGNEMTLDSDGTGGTGVVIHEDGIIITNAHIIPHDNEVADVNEEGCIVLFPDTRTGLPMQAYYADPVIIPDLSDEYDLAMLVINGVYGDAYGNSYGDFPNIFPSINNDNCDDEYFALGEKVTVYGYPNVTGGYSLTVTDGLISAFNQDGIVTSAKIDSGNSGGLAVDANGCFVGIPTLVNFGEAESYGVIVPSYDIADFLEKMVELQEEN